MSGSLEARLPSSAAPRVCCGQKIAPLGDRTLASLRSPPGRTVASPVFDSRVLAGLLSGFVEACWGLTAPPSRQLASFLGQSCWLHGGAQLTTCSAGADSDWAAWATVETSCSAEIAGGVCVPLAGFATLELDGPEVCTVDCR